MRKCYNPSCKGKYIQTKEHEHTIEWRCNVCNAFLGTMKEDLEEEFKGMQKVSIMNEETGCYEDFLAIREKGFQCFECVYCEKRGDEYHCSFKKCNMGTYPYNPTNRFTNIGGKGTKVCDFTFKPVEKKKKGLEMWLK